MTHSRDAWVRPPDPRQTGVPLSAGGTPSVVTAQHLRKEVMAGKSAGEILRDRINQDLQAINCDLTGKEEQLLDTAVSISDRIEALERDIDEHGLYTEGSKGRVLNPSVTEVRQQQSLLKGIMYQLDLTPEEAPDAKSQRGRKNSYGRPRGVASAAA